MTPHSPAGEAARLERVGQRIRGTQLRQTQLGTEVEQHRAIDLLDALAGHEARERCLRLVEPPLRQAAAGDQPVRGGIAAVCGSRCLGHGERRRDPALVIEAPALPADGTGGTYRSGRPAGGLCHLQRALELVDEQQRAGHRRPCVGVPV